MTRDPISQIARVCAVLSKSAVTPRRARDFRRSGRDLARNGRLERDLSRASRPRPCRGRGQFEPIRQQRQWSWTLTTEPACVEGGMIWFRDGGSGRLVCRVLNLDLQRLLRGKNPSLVF
jgi:hypothetical protein